MEKTPTLSREPKKGRISRSHDRPRYGTLKPFQIRTILGIEKPSDDSASRAPHERRRHWRTLPSERFTYKQGQRILIEACWVGPHEAVVGKTRYKVRLDI